MPFKYHQPRSGASINQNHWSKLTSSSHGSVNKVRQVVVRPV